MGWLFSAFILCHRDQSSPRAVSSGAGILAALWLCLGLTISSSAAEPSEAKWIWCPTSATEESPRSPMFARRTFDLKAPEAGQIQITCDDEYQLFVNGRTVGRGSAWNEMQTYDLLPYLVAGKNVIAVRCVNGASAAGLVARLKVKSKGEAEQTLSTDKSWKTSLDNVSGWNRVPFDDAQWAGAHEYGEFLKIGPWGAGIKVQPPSETLKFASVKRPEGKFQLVDGERIVLLGDTLIERAQRDEYLETWLTVMNPNKSIQVRNLGWSGDTVFGDARAGFGTAEDGFKQLRQQVFDFRPTLILIAYGGATPGRPSADELPRFAAGYETLLQTLSDTQAELVLASPIPHEEMPPPFPDPSASNQLRAQYRNAIQEIAKSHSLQYVDLWEPYLKARPNSQVHLTDNGIHLTPRGYWHLGRMIAEHFQLPAGTWSVDLTADGKLTRATGAAVTDLKAAADGTLSLTVRDEHLPLPPATGSRWDQVGINATRAQSLRKVIETAATSPSGSEKTATAAPIRLDSERMPRLIKVTGLPAGEYQLKADDRVVANGSHTQFAAGIALEQGPDFDQVEQLRQVIAHKNELFFHRWRPQNETYLFGFRKHEQGQNAREIPMFDPLILDLEKQIAELRQPKPHRYTLSKKK